MDCEKCKQNIVDYIHGETQDNEEVKKHLEICEECKLEYENLKETIGYLKTNSQKINTNKELNLNKNIKKNKIRSVRRTGLIAIFLSIFLVATVFAAEKLGFLDWWKDSSKIQTNAWEELIENGVGQKLDISTEDNGVKITAKGIIADEINTLVLLEIENLNEDRRLTPSYNAIFKNPTHVPWPVIVEGDIENFYEDTSPFVNITNIYTEDKNKLNILVNTNTMTKDKGKFTLNIDTLETMINESEEDIKYVEGNWTLEIEGEKIPSKIYEVGKEINLDGNEVIIDKVVIAPTTTQIDYRFKVENEKVRYNLDSIDFSMEYKGERFANSPISYDKYSDYTADDEGYTNRKYHLYPLYLKDPKEVTLNIDTKRYSTRGERYYDIDWGNLPEKIEYNNSELTVKSIDIGEEKTEIIIEEDNSKDRKYLKSNITFRKSNNLENEEYDRPYMHSGDYLLRGEYTKYEVENINTDESEDKLKGFENNKEYVYAEEQKFIIRKNDFEEAGIPELYKKKYIIPEYLVIHSQEYIDFPDKKVDIKLK
ncbi:DUF4179 domain-containing protein [Senegalia massiliensis]|uniref:DUF4179 domain-containing protein n=1 Tax=Senegalia massiliensis TaxID=1720316 RepID=UPI0010311049|nr:DUF4179 domain-containing protein [Senegalia massiliensis]